MNDESIKTFRLNSWGWRRDERKRIVKLSKMWEVRKS